MKVEPNPAAERHLPPCVIKVSPRKGRGLVPNRCSQGNATCKVDAARIRKTLSEPLPRPRLQTLGVRTQCNHRCSLGRLQQFPEHPRGYLGATPWGYTRDLWRAVRPDFTGLSRSRFI